jgi:hypothetical protein
MVPELLIVSLNTYKSEFHFPQPTTNYFPTKLKLISCVNNLGSPFPKFVRSHFWLLKITTDHYIIDDVNMVCPDDRFPKLNIYISEMIPGSHEYTHLAYVTRRCMN